MIRIEGIPIVAARLADAEKTQSTQTSIQRRRTSKIDAGGNAPLAIRSVLPSKTKVA